MNGKVYGIKLVESIILMISICCMLILCTYKNAGRCMIDNSNIDNDKGITYFHSYYDEIYDNDIDAVYTQKEQNYILREMQNTLQKTKYEYMVNGLLCINELNSMAVNSNTLRYAGIEKFVEKGILIEGEVEIDSSKEIEIPVVIGNNLKQQYDIGDTIETNLYNNNLQFIVKGILSEGTKIEMVYFEDVLDDYIIIPQLFFLNEPEERNELQLQNFFLMFQCNGYFEYNEDIPYEEIKKYCDDLAHMYEVDWECSEKIENNLKDVKLPLNYDMINIYLFVLLLVTYIALTAILKAFIHEKKKEKNDMLPIRKQARSTLYLVVYVIVIYEISLIIVKSKILNAIYYEYLMEGRAVIILFLIIYIVVKESICWTKMNRLWR